MDRKNINEWTILSLLAVIAGLLFYVYWGLRYGVWIDEGIYSITIFLVVSGICGVLLSRYIKREE